MKRGSTFTLLRTRLLLVAVSAVLAAGLASVCWASPAEGEGRVAAVGMGPQFMPPKPGVFVHRPGEGWFTKEGRRILPPISVPAPRGVGPVTGTGKILVILLEFQDVKFDTAHTPAYYNEMLFHDSNPWSMKSYFEENSYGNYTVTGEFAGPVTSAHTMAYYGKDGADIDGYNGPIYEMVREAVTLLDPTVDFSQYDEDHDRVVDHVVVIHAGPGQEGGGGPYGSDAIWSHRWFVAPPATTSDGVVVQGYTTDPEDGLVGVFCHEFGHDLGLPDLYDRDGSSEGLGNWSLMASGSWNARPGGPPESGPAHMTAWEKAQLGWVTPVVVGADQDGVSIPAVESQPNNSVFQLWTGGATTPEKFLVENRQKIGFDAGLPGAGLLIYHVDDSVTTQNDNEAHYLVALEQADGDFDLEAGNNRGDTGDPFPGATDNHAFSDDTTPGARNYSLLRTFVGVLDITPNPDGSVAADLRVAPPAVPATPTPLEPSGTCTSVRPLFRWTGVEGASSYDVWIGNPGDVPGGGAGTVTTVYTPYYRPASDFAWGAHHVWAVRAGNSLGTSAWSSVMDFTIPVQAPVLLIVDDGGGFGIAPYYEQALADAGVYYNEWDFAKVGSPLDVLGHLAAYDIVVFCGDWGVIYNSPELVDGLVDYLDGGGRLFLTSQDFGWGSNAGRVDPELFDDYLHAVFRGDDADVPYVVGQAGTPFEGDVLCIYGGDGANNQLYPDCVDPETGRQGLSVLMTYAASPPSPAPPKAGKGATAARGAASAKASHALASPRLTEAAELKMRALKQGVPATRAIVGSGTAALYYDSASDPAYGGANDFRTAYFAFGLEGVNDRSDRAATMGKVCALLMSDDSSAPILTDLTDTSLEFTPNHDGVSDTFPVVFSVSEPVAATVWIERDMGGGSFAAVRHLAVGKGIPTGTSTFEWDGYDDAMTLQPAGAYRYMVEVRDIAGNTASIVGDTFQLTGVGGAVTSVSVDPAVFTPNGDGQDDQTTISYSISEDGSVSVLILRLADSTWQVVRHLASGSQTAGDYQVVWDGTDDASNTVAEGDYVAAVGHVADSTYSEGLAVVGVEVNDPVLSDVYFDEPVFCSNPVGSQPFAVRSSTLHATVSKPAAVTVKVYDASDSLVRTLLDGAAVPAGEFTVTWDGKNDALAAVADGVYHAVVEAVDRGGLEADPVQAEVEVDSTPVSITLDATDAAGVYGYTYFEFSPNGDGNYDTISFTFTLSEDVIYAVYRVSYIGATTWIQNLQHDLEELPQGQYTVTWDGTDYGGVVQPDNRLYYVAIRNYDYAWNRSQYNLFVSIDTTTGEATIVGCSPEVFSPNGDSVADTTQAEFTTSDIGFARLTVEKDGVVVRTLCDDDGELPVEDLIRRVLGSAREDNASIAAAGVTGVTRIIYDPADVKLPGTYDIAWDGKTDEGDYAADGVYDLHLVFSDVTANVTDTTMEDAVEVDTYAEATIGSGGGSVGLVDGTEVVVPAGAVPDGTQFSVHALDPDELPPNPTDPHLTFLGVGRDMASSAGKLAKPVTVVIPYPDLSSSRAGTTGRGTTGAGAGGRGGKPASEAPPLRIYYWDAVKQRWEPVGGVVDSEAGTVSAETNHLSVFGLMLDEHAIPDEGGALLSGVVMSFNPFSPNGDGVRDWTAVRFMLNQAASVTVRVFTSTGKLVRTVVRDFPGDPGYNSVVWDGTNDSGKVVGSGIYVVKVSATAGDGRTASVVKTVGVVYETGAH